MNANELRIGNIIRYRDVIICKVSNLGNHFETINNKGLLYGSDDANEYNGVELTEKWLLDFGFGKSDEHELGINEHPNFNFYYNHYFKEFVLDVFDDDGVNSAFVKMNIKYIHQLQNLYFALTNKELQLING